MLSDAVIRVTWQSFKIVWWASSLTVLEAWELYADWPLPVSHFG